jgi:hypothetical protein
MKSLIDKPWLYIVLLAIGLFFKVYQIDQKFFWYDEIATIAHTSGNQIAPPPENKVHSIQYYKDQLRLNKQDYSLGSEISGLFSSVLRPFVFRIHSARAFHSLDLRLCRVMGSGQ